MASSKFVEILDDNLANPVAQQRHISDSDVKLEDVLADHEATIQQHQRSRSSTQSSSTPSRKSHEFNPTTLSGTGSNRSSDDQRLSDTTESQGLPLSSTTNSSPTSPMPRIKRLRKFTLSGGFGR